MRWDIFKTASVIILSTSVNNETNTKTVPQYFGIFYAKKPTNTMYMHAMVKSMNFGGGGAAESLHYYALKQNFPFKKKRVRGLEWRLRK